MFPLAFTPTLSTPVCYGYGSAIGKVGFLLPDQRSFRQTYNPTANDETGTHAILEDQCTARFRKCKALANEARDVCIEACT